MDTVYKDPGRVLRGRAGARKRWGGQRVVRLDSLTPAQRDVVLALIGTMKATPGIPASLPGAASVGGHGDDRPTS